MWKALSDVARPFKIKRERLEKFVDDSKESVNKIWKSEQVQSVVRSTEKLKDMGAQKISKSGIRGKVKDFKKNPDQFSVFASYLLVDLIFAVSKLVEKLGGNIRSRWMWIC